MSSRLRQHAHIEDELDGALEDTFPASDPVAMTDPSTPVATPIPEELVSHKPGPQATPPAECDLGRDERIRRRAYEIWARAGHPAGREVEHWAQAEREIDAEDREKPGPAADLPASAPDLATGHA